MKGDQPVRRAQNFERADAGCLGTGRLEARRYVEAPAVEKALAAKKK